MSKRLFKETLKRIRWLCSRCDLSYDLLPKSFGLEQIVPVRRLVFPPKDDFRLCFSLSEELKYLDSFHSDVKAQQKLLRKKDKAFRSQVLEACTKVGMGCFFTKRTRLNPQTYRIYDAVEHEQVLGPNLSASDVWHVLSINHNQVF